MEAAYEFTKAYVKERKAFGKTIVSYNCSKLVFIGKWHVLF